MIKAVLLDRDGTINEDHGYICRSEDFVLIPGVLDALKTLTENKIDIFIVTNQSGIARGYYTEDNFHELTRYMLDTFQSYGIIIKDVLFCPHHLEGVVPEYTKTCDCRKPQTGMLDKIMDRYGYQADEVVLIGDKNSDIMAGVNRGIKTYLVETGYGSMHKKNTKADFVLRDLQACVGQIVTQHFRGNR